MLLIPAHAVALMLVLADQLDDLTAPRRLSVEAARLDPIAYVGTPARWMLGGHGLIDLTRNLTPSHRGRARNRHVVIYGAKGCR